MKIKTNLKSGSMVADTRQEISNLSGQAGDFFHTANQQAEGVTGAVSSAVGSLRSGVANLIGLS